MTVTPGVDHGVLGGETAVVNRATRGYTLAAEAVDAVTGARGPYDAPRRLCRWPVADQLAFVDARTEPL